VLLVASAAAFVVGVAIERSRPSEAHRESSASAQVTTATKGETHAASTETGTNAEPGTTAEAATTAESATTTETTGGTAESGGGTKATTTTSVHATEASTGATHSDSGEKLLGIKTESTGLVVAAIVASAALALALWFVSGSALLLLGAAAVGITFAAFDLREATHQANLSDTTLVVVALAVAVLHLAVTAASGVGMRLQRRGAKPA
jgi:hypothetical protein